MWRMASRWQDRVEPKLRKSLRLVVKNAEAQQAGLTPQQYRRRLVRNRKRAAAHGQRVVVEGAEAEVERLKKMLIVQSRGGKDMLLVFRRMDKNKDGTVSSIELQRAVERLLGNRPLKRTTKLEILRQVDHSQDGYINCTEFLTWLLGKASVDANNDGDIHEQELIAAALGHRILDLDCSLQVNSESSMNEPKKSFMYFISATSSTKKVFCTI